MQIANEKEWIIAPQIPENIKSELSGVSDIMQQILYNRGIMDSISAAQFFNKEANAYDPFLLQNMDKAVERIFHAIDTQESIAVFGDYDADGITSTALLSEVLNTLGAHVTPYIPEREEGYGVNTNAIDFLYDQKISLIITVDCGIRSPEELRYAQELGMTVIVTDHHVPAETIPDVHCVICPRVKGDQYPDKNLSGVGIAYKLAQALFQIKNGSIEFADEWLDLAAIGTVADVVPLLGENRLIVTKGITAIRFSKRIGLKSLIAVAGFDQRKINTVDISFGIAPRLNAAGRLDSPKKALNLLLTKDMNEAGLLSQELDDINRKRQKITQDMQELAQKEIDENNLIIHVFDKEFTSGLVGLVSAKLTEFFYRPSIVGYIGDEYTRASCRSIPEFNITNALDNCENLLVRHGGHAMAAGFTVVNENLEKLIEKLELIAETELDPKDLRPKINIDIEYPLYKIPIDILNELDQLEPLGAENSEAVFVSRGVEVKNARTVGRDENHLKLRLRDRHAEYDAIAFNQGFWGKEMPTRIDVVYSIERNHYNGNIYKQLRVKDLKPSF
ncbi:MAG: single-stranded-DNA-specific exonuclease RecJ [Chloroflexi bacterium HGW-Chloroflexi-3]|nr:MAG: single-stranded-DNA-specific exonuclease RecJ [Chloroflexi bacterium HGW-Chloroflexi-3]